MDISGINYISKSDIKNKVILLRADLNLPIIDGKVIDTLRLERILATIRFLITKNCKVVLISHLGRPGGQKNLDYSLSRILETLKSNLNISNIKFSNDCIGDNALETINFTKFGELCLLENLRFYKEEELNDQNFAEKLARVGDIYVNDAFSCCHRNHASIVGIPKYLPSFAGIGLEKEIKNINEILEKPRRPLMVIIGGSKISTKLNTLKNIVKKAEFVAIGGAMANTFLAAKNIEIGRSLYEKNMKSNTIEILRTAEDNNCDVILPFDFLTSNNIKSGSKAQEFDIDKIPKDKMIFDIGKKSTSNIINKMKLCNSVVWNGPLGAFEYSPFDLSTNKISNEIAKLTLDNKINSLAGGGDTVAALSKANNSKNFSYLSTAGGAFLEWLEGKELPGISVLKNN